MPRSEPSSKSSRPHHAAASAVREPAAAGRPRALDGHQRFHRRLQRDRSIAITVAALVAIVGHRARLVALDAGPALGLLLFGYSTSLLFFSLHATAWARRHERPLAAAWLACDIGMVTSLVYLTGGVTSPWFLWYLACAGAAAFVGGMSWALAVAVGSSVAYLALLVAMGDIDGVDQGLYAAAAQMTFLFGASSSLILGTIRLRADHGKIKRLQDSEAITMWELSLLTSELDAANAQLREINTTDPLTGLHNRRYLQERISGRRDRRSRTPSGTTGVLVLDLDHFKSINDTHGHHSGDEVLCHVADLLRRAVRGGDSVVRWGGEEFLILLAGSATERTREIVQRILHSVRSEPCTLANGTALRLTCSIGWSELPAAETLGATASWDDVFNKADRALYMAKASGRDRAFALLPRAELAEDHPIEGPRTDEQLGPRRIAACS